MKCLKCGTEIQENEKFCSNCGSEIIKKENIDEIQKTIDGNKDNKNKTDKKKIIFIIIGILVIAIIGCLILASNESNNTNDKIEEKEEEQDVIEDEEKEVTENTNTNNSKKLYIIKKVYKESDYEYIEIEENDNIEQEEDYKKELVGTYTCNNEDCKNLLSYNYENINNFVYVYDEELVFYNYKNDKTYKTNIKFTLDENNDYNEEVELVGTKDKLYGFILYNDYSSVDNRTAKYYSFSKNKFDLKFEKDIPNSSLGVYESYIKNGYFVQTTLSEEYGKNCTSSLIGLNDGKEYSKLKEKTYSIFEFNEDTIITVEGCEVPKNGKIDFLDDNFKSIFGKSYDDAVVNDNNIIVYNNNSKEYEIYNKKTKEITKKTLDYKILNMIKDYILVEKDGNYTLMNYEHKILKEFGSTKNTSLSPFFSYYEAHDDKPAGIYFGVEDSKKEDYCYEYYYNPTSGESKKFDIECGGYAKPVLYLYPTKTTEVTINFEKENMLTTTYPKFNKEWKVTAHKNGDLYDLNGNYYYALYWEEAKNHTVDFSEGFYVTKENAITFLEEKLTYIGLNAKERNEFIMYWLPILEKNKKNLVYFELTEERDSYNKIYINPKPDSLLRVAIHVKKVDKEVNIKEQKLTQFKRSGFTAVEWGGVKY